MAWWVTGSQTSNTLDIGFSEGRTEGRTDGRTATWLPKFLGWIDYQILLGMGLRSREDLHF